MFNLTCPNCQSRLEFERMQDAPDRPFCSRRCQMIDLGEWLNGTYRISEPLSPTDYPAGEDAIDDRDVGADV